MGKIGRGLEKVSMVEIPECMIPLIVITKTIGGKIMKEDLKRVYEVFPWKMRPTEEEARVRFEHLVELFKEIVDFPEKNPYPGCCSRKWYNRSRHDEGC